VDLLFGTNISLWGRTDEKLCIDYGETTFCAEAATAEIVGFDGKASIERRSQLGGHFLAEFRPIIPDVPTTKRRIGFVIDE
jgi:hypothetical protein